MSKKREKRKKRQKAHNKLMEQHAIRRHQRNLEELINQVKLREMEMSKDKAQESLDSVNPLINVEDYVKK